MLFFKPNVSPEVFEVIFNFLYGGTVCLAEYDAKVILDVLKATDELCIPDLSEYIQNYLITHPWRLMSHFVFVHRFATEQGERYPKIRKCVIELIKENPATIFDSSDFTTMDQNTLLSFFKCQHFFMKPVEIWKRIIEWGIANTPSLPNPKTKWETENYNVLGESLKPFIPLIKFDEMNYDEFLREVQPWRNSLDYVDHELYGKVDTSIQLANINDRSKTNYINSVLITTYDAETISKWIKDISSSPDNYQHNFQLILRGSKDGFTPKQFHDLCDGKGPTLTILREKHSGEILGGFNPLNWHSMVAGSYSPTDSSFIFSLGDKVFCFDRVLSQIIDRNKAIYQNGNYGPCFGGGESDLRLFGYNFNEDIRCRCVKTSYQNKIRNNEDEFCIDELEVFQVITLIED
ncbi:kelch-like protein 17 [Gigaspora margarita]|nr:kelch-like protein 17 [Gigaspora margarita]